MRQLAVALAAVFVLVGCGGSAPPAKPAEAPAKAAEGHDHDKDHDHDHDHDHDEDHHHHDPTRGGTLVELGDHVGNIEFVLDSASGKLTAYCSDAHAENPVRLKNDALVISVTPPGGTSVEVRLAAAANPLTGEAVGDTSQFEAVVEGLKGQTTFEAAVAPLEYRGVQVEATSFTYTASTPK